MGVCAKTGPVPSVNTLGINDGNGTYFLRTPRIVGEVKHRTSQGLANNGDIDTKDFVIIRIGTYGKSTVLDPTGVSPI